MVCYDKWEYNEVLYNNARGDIINSHAKPFHLTQHIEIPIHHLYKIYCHSGLYYVPYTDTSVKKRLENATNVNKVPRSFFFICRSKEKKCNSFIKSYRMIEYYMIQ